MGIVTIKEYIKTHETIPESMFIDALEELTIKYSEYPSISIIGYPATLYGKYIACDYCGRVLTDKTTCEGCGA